MSCMNSLWQTMVAQSGEQEKQKLSWCPVIQAMPQPPAQFPRHRLFRTSFPFSTAYNFSLFQSCPLQSDFFKILSSKYRKLCGAVMDRSQSLEKIKQMTKKLQRLGSLKNALSFKLRRRSFDQEEEEEQQTERRRSESSVPRGHLAVYAAKEDRQRRRFVIPVDYLKQPVFKHLLRMAEEEFGFDYDTGLLTIPCDPLQFEEIINRLKHSDGVAALYKPMTSLSSACASASKSYFSNVKTVMVH